MGTGISVPGIRFKLVYCRHSCDTYRVSMHAIQLFVPCTPLQLFGISQASIYGTMILLRRSRLSVSRSE